MYSLPTTHEARKINMRVIGQAAWQKHQRAHCKLAQHIWQSEFGLDNKHVQFLIVKRFRRRQSFSASCVAFLPIVLNPHFLFLNNSTSRQQIKHPVLHAAGHN